MVFVAKKAEYLLYYFGLKYLGFTVICYRRLLKRRERGTNQLKDEGG